MIGGVREKYAAICDPTNNTARINTRDVIESDSVGLKYRRFASFAGKKRSSDVKVQNSSLGVTPRTRFR